MSEKDVLNPTTGWTPELQDSMSPDYGFTRKRSTTQLRKKAVGGTPWTRETQNTGHTLTLSWMSRPWHVIEKLKWFYEQFEDGYFTIIDHDGGGRHYVGRFTTEVSPVETANGMWDAQNVTFEEMPQVPMLQYPNDWNRDAIWMYAVNDLGDQKLAVNGTWAQTARQMGGFTRQTFDDAGATVGDWAQYEFRGYGFQLWALKGPAQGVISVSLDGAQLANIDCYAAAGPIEELIYTKVNVPLDIHRVMMTVQGNGSTISGFVRNAGATSGATAASWYALKVMR